MKSFDLTDLIPEKSEIKLAINGNEKAYVLRPLNLEDETWVKRKFGDRIEDIFKNLEMDKICQIVYRLMEDKTDFKMLEIKEINDDGEEVLVKKTGPDRLMKCVVGKQHQIDILNSLLATFGASRPILDKIEQEELARQESKKKQIPPKGQQTGQKSLTQ